MCRLELYFRIGGCRRLSVVCFRVSGFLDAPPTSAKIPPFGRWCLAREILENYWLDRRHFFLEGFVELVDRFWRDSVRR